MKKSNTFYLVLAALFTAMGLILPQIFHMFNLSGSIFSPMHIPVILCGMICGYKWGGITGFLIPLLSSFLTSMPPLVVALYMACELATYGIISGILIKKLNVVFTLIIAMISGRIVLGIAQLFLAGFGLTNGFAFEAFITGAFITALPGIIIQIITIPVIMTIYKKFQGEKND